MGGVTRNRIARLNADGTLDSGFDPNANSKCSGHGGASRREDRDRGLQFTSVGGVTCNRIARLNANGTLDSGFNPNANDGVRSTAWCRPTGRS